MRSLVVAVVLTIGCAHAGPLEVRQPEGQRGFSLEKGAWADFRDTTRVCISATDTDLGLDLVPTVSAAIQTRVPGVRSNCGSPFDGIRVEYHSSYSACTHCPAPYRGPRFGFGFLWRDQQGHRIALALWVDTHGGTPAQVAEAFAEDLATFVLDPEKARRSEPRAAEQ